MLWTKWWQFVWYSSICLGFSSPAALPRRWAVTSFCMQFGNQLVGIELKYGCFLDLWEGDLKHYFWPRIFALPFSCPQISTAYIMTSSDSVIAVELSMKKADSNYWDILLNYFFSLLQQPCFHSLLQSSGFNRHTIMSSL